MNEKLLYRATDHIPANIFSIKFGIEGSQKDVLKPRKERFGSRIAKHARPLVDSIKETHGKNVCTIMEEHRFIKMQWKEDNIGLEWHGHPISD